MSQADPFTISMNAAPANPVDGDLWFDGGGALCIRVGGVTRPFGPLLGAPLEGEKEPYKEPEPEPVLPTDPEERRIAEMFQFLEKRRAEESPPAPVPSEPLLPPISSFLSDPNTGMFKVSMEDIVNDDFPVMPIQPSAGLLPSKPPYLVNPYLILGNVYDPSAGILITDC